MFETFINRNINLEVGISMVKFSEWRYGRIMQYKNIKHECKYK